MQDDHPLRIYRRQRGLTLDAFAAAAETTGATLSRVEKGLLKPGFGLLGRLVAATAGVVTADAILKHAQRPAEPGKAA